MIDRRALILHGAAATVLIQTPPVPSEALPLVLIETDAGRIVIATDVVAAPVTAGNFLRYVDEGRFDGTEFYRAMALPGDTGLIQGGTNSDPARVLPAIAHEPTTETGLRHEDGVVSMARYEPGTATGDFFIVVGGLPSLNARPGDPGDNAGFAAFGRVVEGMDVVRTILAAPKSPTEGEGFLQGQMLDPRITIQSARRL